MRTIALTLAALLSSVCVAQNNEVIERSLTADSKREHRLIDGREVVLQLSGQGVLKRKPSERQDYSSFYIPKQTVFVLGAKLVSFEHEYQTRYIGCCVNPGNAVILQPTHGTAAIEAFALRNRCKYSVGNKIFYVPQSAAIALTKPDRDSLVEVSCKDNYLFDSQGRTP